MNIFFSVKLNDNSRVIKAELYPHEDEFHCKTLDSSVQVLGYTPGAALDMFLERLDHRPWKT